MKALRFFCILRGFGGEWLFAIRVAPSSQTDYALPSRNW